MVKYKDYGVSDEPIVKKLSEMMGTPMTSPYALVYEGQTRVNPYDKGLEALINFCEEGDPFDEGNLYEEMPYLDLPPIFIDVAAEIIRVSEERTIARGYDESVFLHGRYDKTKDRARAVARWGEDWKLGDPVPDCVKNGVPDAYNI